MVNIHHFLSEFLSSNILLALLLSISWIPVFGLFKVTGIVAPNLIIRYPAYIKLRIWRFVTGISKRQKNIFTYLPPDYSNNNKLSNEIALMIKQCDRFLSELVIGRTSLLNYMFPILKLKDISNKMMEENMTLLEKDHAIFTMFSETRNNREIGLLNFLNNPQTKRSEARRLLFYLLAFGKTDLSDILLFHITDIIKNNSDYNELEAIRLGVPIQLQDNAKKALDNVRKQLPIGLQSNIVSV